MITLWVHVFTMTTFQLGSASAIAAREKWGEKGGNLKYISFPVVER